MTKHRVHVEMIWRQPPLFQVQNYNRHQTHRAVIMKRSVGLNLLPVAELLSGQQVTQIKPLVSG